MLLLTTYYYYYYYYYFHFYYYYYYYCQGGVLAEWIQCVKYGVDFLFLFCLAAFVEGAEGRVHQEEVTQCTALEAQLFMSAVRLASE